jgi:hypothetical protein
MTHDELIAYIDDSTNGLKHEDIFSLLLANTKALRAVVELHKNYRLDGIYYECSSCGKSTTYCPTIQVIEKELV